MDAMRQVAGEWSGRSIGGVKLVMEPGGGTPAAFSSPCRDAGGERLPADVLLERLALTRNQKLMLGDLSDSVSSTDYVGFGSYRTGPDLAEDLRWLDQFGAWGWTQGYEREELEALVEKLLPLGHGEVLCLLSRYRPSSGDPVFKEALAEFEEEFEEDEEFEEGE
jgi:hypothetical protein